MKFKEERSDDELSSIFGELSVGEKMIPVIGQGLTGRSAPRTVQEGMDELVQDARMFAEEDMAQARAQVAERGDANKRSYDDVCDDTDNGADLDDSGYDGDNEGEEDSELDEISANNDRLKKMRIDEEGRDSGIRSADPGDLGHDAHAFDHLLPIGEGNEELAEAMDLEDTVCSGVVEQSVN